MAAMSSMLQGFKPEDRDFIQACFNMTHTGDDHDNLFYGFTPAYVQFKIPSFVLTYPDCTTPLQCPLNMNSENREMWNTIIHLKTQFLIKRGESTVCVTNDDQTSTAFAFVSQPPRSFSSPEQCAANVAALVAAAETSKTPDVLEVNTRHEAEVYGPIFTKNLAMKTATNTAQQSAKKGAQAVAENEAKTKPNTSITKAVSVTVQNTTTVHARVREDGQIITFTESVTVSATESHTAIYRPSLVKITVKRFP
jgi:hypothetical protein